MRQPPKPDWLDTPSHWRAPLFGYNAVPFTIQFVVGIVLVIFFDWIGVDDAGRYLMKLLIDSLG